MCRRIENPKIGCHGLGEAKLLLYGMFKLVHIV